MSPTLTDIVFQIKIGSCLERLTQPKCVYLIFTKFVLAFSKQFQKL